MSTQDFLVEIGTEELPPKALKRLSEAFGNGIKTGLEQANLAFTGTTLFASPRRLAVRVSGLQLQQPDIEVEKKGPAVKAAFDADGNPTRALQGFASSCGVTPDELSRIETPKGEWLVYRSTQAGQAATALLPDIISNSLNQLPIPKRMRWGARKVEFVRPAHWIVMLLGEQVVPATILGHESGNQTRGHRFHCNEILTINTPSEYEGLLENQGYVIADFAKRRDKIRQAVIDIAKQVSGTAVIDEDLLDEVTALNEWPVPLIGKFEERFLDVPAEALISSMKEHQKYFHVVDADGKMLPNFITISNIESKDPTKVVEGNEKVIRPRLSDAAFFFETDKKSTLESRIERLKPIVFQEKLGTIYDKCVRVAGLAEKLADKVGSDPALAQRAAMLAKTDLVSEMVLEFPELQGIMGYHYATADGENQEVAKALDEQYMPRFAGDQLPETATGAILSIADRLDSLVGLFGIKQPPSGTKDPFALRRATLGILRIIVEKKLPLDLAECIELAISQHQNLTAENLNNTVLDYMLERFRAWYEDEGIAAEVYLAVHARKPTRPVDFDRRVHAVNAFLRNENAQALAAANKRVSNILSKQDAEVSSEIDSNLFQEDAEKALASNLAELNNKVQPLFAEGDYEAALTELAALRQSVDQFFDDVMVMADDMAIRNNRLALLSSLRNLFLQVADISLLQSAS
ncbi:glycyl-tRNA synthetase subunit beta [Oleiphilus messinensis]|uniref:Glycine--tRNA ligase beta subunit n=1 Tax=Oleiphilus messinensis TaxID=141451 RepID=A0A1Y0I108_9GAMM|nr:glycine--tRNA ligase subunit beta [Oleiphilus messinensis]ARU54137.1 glycyl-tRNA synthetase subunit beta [Oleiphilus messinensis]